MGPPAGSHAFPGHRGGSTGLIQVLDTPPWRPQGCGHISGGKACVTHTSPFMGNRLEARLRKPLGFPGGSAGKESACNEGDLGFIPGSGRFPGEGRDYPLQYSGLENSMD